MTQTQTFKRFVIFAEMRTGSNFLEATLNAIRRVTCFGEAFNPYMMGWPDKTELRGVTQAERDADPKRLLDAIFSIPDHLPGFRYFHDHDPRVFDLIMQDRECAKIVLSRNVLDSYVSTELARQTNQWKLNETETPIPASIHFDRGEFRRVYDEIGAFQQKIQHGLQRSGQAAFWLGYNDLRDTGVMTGLLHWLGRTDLEKVELAKDQVPQNPRSLSEKVTNFVDMKRDLARLDPFALHEVPNFEPKRGPNLGSVIACEAGEGVLFLPMSSGPTRTLTDWLGGQGELEQNFTHQTLRQWKNAHKGHRSFTVLRHPLARAWTVFTEVVEGNRGKLRQILREIHRLPLPPDGELAGMSQELRLQCFEGFLDFLRRNLNGQTSFPVQQYWASQVDVLAGMGQFVSPDFVLREERLNEGLGWLAAGAGLGDVPECPADPMPEFLDNEALHKAVHRAYARDYMAFGFT